jgi:hypothetical protein
MNQASADALVALWRDPDHVNEVIANEARRLAECSPYSAEEISAAVYELLEEVVTSHLAEFLISSLPFS